VGATLLDTEFLTTRLERPATRAVPRGQRHGAQTFDAANVRAEGTELGGQESQVEADVVPNDDPIANPLGQVAGNVGERRSVGHLGGGDAVDPGWSDVSAWVDKSRPFPTLTGVRIKDDDAELYDPIVPLGKQPGGLEVNDSEPGGARDCAGRRDFERARSCRRRLAQLTPQQSGHGIRAPFLPPRPPCGDALPTLCQAQGPVVLFWLRVLLSGHMWHRAAMSAPHDPFIVSAPVGRQRGPRS
jgi:hypothetical protein